MVSKNYKTTSIQLLFHLLISTSKLKSPPPLNKNTFGCAYLIYAASLGTKFDFNSTRFDGTDLLQQLAMPVDRVLTSSMYCTVTYVHVHFHWPPSSKWRSCRARRKWLPARPNLNHASIPGPWLLVIHHSCNDPRPSSSGARLSQVPLRGAWAK
jgi:hypothetical protein